MLKQLFLLPGYLIRFWLNVLFVFGGLKNMGDAQRFLASNTQFGLVINSILCWVGVLVLTIFILGHKPVPAGGVPTPTPAPTAVQEEVAKYEADKQLPQLVQTTEPSMVPPTSSELPSTDLQVTKVVEHDPGPHSLPVAPDATASVPRPNESPSEAQ
jgi:hypothetical protein